MRLSKAMMKKWFDYGVQRLTKRTEVGPVLAFVAVIRFCEVNCDALGSHDWFPYEHKTGKRSRVDRLALLVCMLTHGTDGKTAGTDGIGLIFSEGLDVRGMSFISAGVALLQYLCKKIYYFVTPFLEAQHALVNRRLGPAVSVSDAGQASLAVVAGADDPIDDYDDWTWRMLSVWTKLNFLERNVAYVIFKIVSVPRSKRFLEPLPTRSSLLNSW